jgi:ATP synthase protein I
MKQADNRAPKSGSDPASFLQKATGAFQENVTEAAPVAAAGYTLIGAIIFLGLIGYFVDRWLHTSPWLLIVGLLLGVIVGFYELAKVAFKR